MNPSPSISAIVEFATGDLSVFVHVEAIENPLQLIAVGIGGGGVHHLFSSKILRESCTDAPYPCGGYPQQSLAPTYRSPFALLLLSTFPPGMDPNVTECFQIADQDGSAFIDDPNHRHYLPKKWDFK